ncbi:MAG: serine/threonine protein kinase, partial [Verrucomicrobiae bacterium]|nr:serine/threonine protein kinase [Verrucomicrobiae bacterium]
MKSERQAPDESDLDFGPTIRGLQSGLKVFGRYSLVRQIGRGGMGVVWLAWDERLARDVALKFLPEMVQGDPVALDELREETNRSLELTHPNIVRIHDLAEESGAAAIVMEYVEGQTLSEIRIGTAGKVLEVEEIAGWIEQACHALAYAHEDKKTVHRDLKPANLMVDGEGRLRVMDFGISGTLTDSMSRLSAAAMPASGTLVYMSPQQAMGFPPTVSDDIYSLGATIYELLTGKPPFYRGNIQHQIETLVAPSMAERREQLGVEGRLEIPASWERTVAACLAKGASDRPKNIEAIREALFYGAHDGGDQGEHSLGNLEKTSPIVSEKSPSPVDREKTPEVPAHGAG